MAPFVLTACDTLRQHGTRCTSQIEADLRRSMVLILWVRCGQKESTNGGGGGIRIPVNGFAVRCLTTRPHHLFQRQSKLVSTDAHPVKFYLGACAPNPKLLGEPRLCSAPGSALSRVPPSGLDAMQRLIPTRPDKGLPGEPLTAADSWENFKEGKKGDL